MANVKISELPAKTTLDGGEEVVIAANGSNNKVSMDTIKQFTNEGTSFDPDGNYPNLHAGIANQIYTEENTISTGEWNFRTTAGDVSVPSEGTGSIVSIKGKTVRTADRVNANFNITCSEGIYVTRFNKYKYISVQTNVDQTLTFNLVDGNWDVDLESMGIFAIYDGISDGTIVVEQTAEDPGYLTSVNPRSLLATGVNQIGTPGWLRLDNATISDGQIVAGNNYIYAVRAYGGVTNGYMARDDNGGIATVGRCQDRPDFGTTITQNNVQGDNFEKRMSFENTGWFVVEDDGSYDQYTGTLSIHPRWSNQEEFNTDPYSSNPAYLPLEDKDYNQLPNVVYGMSSLGNVADEYDFTTKTYIERIQVSGLEYNLLATLYDNGTAFDYDSNYVYYVKDTPTVYQLASSVSVEYTANDYGTEWILDENGNLIPYQLEIITSYGTNLVDKLRTGVATKDQLPQVIHQGQYNSLPESKNSDGVVRFIYTCDKPDNFEAVSNNISSSNIGSTMTFTIAGGISPEGYPFDISITSSDSNVFAVVGTPYIQGDYAYCEITIAGVGTSTMSVTIGGVTKTSTREVYQE